MPGPNVVIPEYIYCVREDLDSILSQVGVELRVDDNEDQTLDDPPEQDYVDESMQSATETVNAYCLGRYSAVRLSQSYWICRRTAVIACVELCRHRGNPVPESLLDWEEEIKKELQKVHDGHLKVPGLPLRQALAPVIDNVRVVPSPYRFKMNRKEQRNSTSDYNRSNLRENTDYQELLSNEFPGG